MNKDPIILTLNVLVIVLVVAVIVVGEGSVSGREVNALKTLLNRIFRELNVPYIEEMIKENDQLFKDWLIVRDESRDDSESGVGVRLHAPPEYLVNDKLCRTSQKLRYYESKDFVAYNKRTPEKHYTLSCMIINNLDRSATPLTVELDPRPKISKTLDFFAKIYPELMPSTTTSTTTTTKPDPSIMRALFSSSKRSFLRQLATTERKIKGKILRYLRTDKTAKEVMNRENYEFSDIVMVMILLYRAQEDEEDITVEELFQEAIDILHTYKHTTTTTTTTESTSTSSTTEASDDDDIFFDDPFFNGEDKEEKMQPVFPKDKDGSTKITPVLAVSPEEEIENVETKPEIESGPKVTSTVEQNAAYRAKYQTVLSLLLVTIILVIAFLALLFYRKRNQSNVFSLTRNRDAFSPASDPANNIFEPTGESDKKPEKKPDDANESIPKPAIISVIPPSAERKNPFEEEEIPKLPPPPSTPTNRRPSSSTCVEIE